MKLQITPNAAWKRFHKIYGGDILKRYHWFLREFGLRAGKLFQKHLLQSLSTIPGTKDYKKSLVIAELRDRGQSWFAILAQARPMSGYDARTHILIVLPRHETLDEDPVHEILEAYGPWTADTLPFLPSERVGQVVVKETSKGEVDSVREKNLADGKEIHNKMIFHGLEFIPRHVLYKVLNVVPDLEVEALRMEFMSGTPAWRPSLRWLKKQGVKLLEKDKDLIRLWTDSRFIKYRQMKRLGVKLTSRDLKRIKSWQDKIRQGAGLRG